MMRASEERRAKDRNSCLDLAKELKFEIHEASILPYLEKTDDYAFGLRANLIRDAPTI